jgi:Lar family restriction alleviation protein
MEKQTTKIKRACPFCGGTETGFTGGNEDFLARGQYWIYCRSCEATGPRCDSLAEAVERWNKRRWTI